MLERKRLISEIFEVGAKPPDESQYFASYNKGNFAILPTQIIPMCVPPGKLDDSEFTSRIDKNRRKWDKFERTAFFAGDPEINMGQEFSGLTQVDGRLKEHDLELPEYLTHRMSYKAPSSIKRNRKGDEMTVYDLDKQISDMYDPKAYNLSPRAFYDKADVLMMFMVDRCLNTPGQSAFERYVCGVPYDAFNKKMSRDKPADDAPEEAKQLWAHQRTTIKEHISRLMLVYPSEVAAGFTEDGNVRLLEDALEGSTQTAKFKFPIFNGIKGSKKMDDFKTCGEGDVDHIQCAPQLMMRIQLLSRSGENAPQSKIDGLHDPQRLYDISGNNLMAVIKLIKTYELEKDFPAILRLETSRGSNATDAGNGTRLSFEDMRIMHIKEIGEPPKGKVSDPEFQEWKEKMAVYPFAPPYVRERDFENEHGKRYDTKSSELLPREMVELETGEAVEKRFKSEPEDNSWRFNLVPLTRKRLAECNGSSIPSLHALQARDKVLAENISNTLRRIMGANIKESSKSSAAIVEATEDMVTEMGELKSVIEDLRRSNARATQNEKRARDEVDELKAELDLMRKKSKRMEISSNGSYEINFTGNADATLFIRASAGTLIHDNGSGMRNFQDVALSNADVTKMKMIFNAASVQHAGDEAHCAIVRRANGDDDDADN